MNDSLHDISSSIEHILTTLYTQGYCVIPRGVPDRLVEMLSDRALQHSRLNYQQAGIGRDVDHQKNGDIRGDAIVWISNDDDVGAAWLAWAEDLKTALNRKLLLGLFSFESHFASYPPGAFYQKHVDAFRGRTNRKLSLVTYLNRDWDAADGGELVIYDHAGVELTRVLPQAGTLVLFLSEDFPHEVLPAQRERYSIAGWFRVNSSRHGVVDPPQ